VTPTDLSAAKLPGARAEQEIRTKSGSSASQTPRTASIVSVQKAGAAYEIVGISVVAAIWREERTQEITMGSTDLEHLETGFEGYLRGLRERAGSLGDASCA
jgi:hypothetical protein